MSNREIVILREAMAEMAELERRRAELLVSPRIRHTVRGETSENGWPYGVTHDMDCPACLASGASFTASPRSETYWSS